MKQDIINFFKTINKNQSLIYIGSDLAEYIYKKYGYELVDAGGFVGDDYRDMWFEKRNKELYIGISSKKIKKYVEQVVNEI